MTKVQDSIALGHAETLEALRDKLAYEIDNCESARDLAQLSRQFREILAELNDRTVPPDSPADKIKREREQRNK